jgi:hypothetical protein
MTFVGYISDIKEIITASSSQFQHDGVVVFQLSEGSRLPPGLSAYDIPGGRTQTFNVHLIRRMNSHLVESDEDRALENILDYENWLRWNCHLDVQSDGEDDCVAQGESGIERDNSIEDLNSWRNGI